ncbi:MAG TPA: PQQ-binding-like beta-propeller repeat protein [Longimicrobium sp.]|jgi:outer membrane protein assembly factor BamB
MTQTTSDGQVPAVSWMRSVAVFGILMLLGASGCRDILGGGSSSKQWIEWKVAAGRSGLHTSFGAPVADDQRVYLGADTGFVAFDRVTGALLWRSPIEKWGGYRNIISRNGALLFATDQLGPAYSLDAATGTVRWIRHDLAGRGVDFPRSAADDLAWYVATRSLDVMALDPETGRTIWQMRLAADWQEDSGMRGLSVSGDTVYAAAERCLNDNCFEVTGVIVALDRRTGAELWRWQAAGKQNNIVKSPVVAGRLLLGGDRIDNTFFAVDRFTGEEVWRVKGERGFVGPYSPPVVADGVAYSGMGDTRVYAAELETGRVLWSTPTGSSIIDVALCGAYVLVHNQALLVIDRQTGRRVATPVPGDDEFTITDITVYGNHAYIAGNRYLYSIRCD